MALDMPTNVVAAIARVKAEVGGIEKLSSAEHKKRGASGGGGAGDQGITYAYRSIEQIVARVGPLFARYGVVIVPSVVKVDRDSFQTKSGATWLDLFLEVEWFIYGPGGRDDVIAGRTVGQGRDNSDKGYNKATTQAYKNLLLRLLDIGDPDDEGEHQRPERDEAPAPPAEPDPADVLYERVRAASAEAKEHLKQMREASGHPLTARAFFDQPAWAEQVREYLDDPEAIPGGVGAAS